MSIRSLFWDNFCKFIETQSDQRLRLFPSRSQGDHQLPAQLGPGRGQGGLRGDDFQCRTRVTAAHRLTVRRRESRTGSGTDPAALPAPPRRHLVFAKQNRLRGGVGRSSPTRRLSPLHLRRAGAAGPGPGQGGGEGTVSSRRTSLRSPAEAAAGGAAPLRGWGRRQRRAGSCAPGPLPPAVPPSLPPRRPVGSARGPPPRLWDGEPRQPARSHGSAPAPPAAGAPASPAGSRRAAGGGAERQQQQRHGGARHREGGGGEPPAGQREPPHLHPAPHPHHPHHLAFQAPPRPLPPRDRPGYDLR